jgi:hypothetical protein
MCILKAAACNRTIAKSPARVPTPLFRRIKYLCEEGAVNCEGEMHIAVN